MLPLLLACNCVGRAQRRGFPFASALVPFVGAGPAGRPGAAGTHCAGVIGAVHNGQGIAGVSPDVLLMGLKFMDADGAGSRTRAGQISNTIFVSAKRCATL